jgi:hypothetical protein
MKKSTATLTLLIIGTLTCSTLVTSCSSKAKQEQTEEHDAMKNDSTQIVYACSMHPDVTGKKEDKCSKCGMDLEEVEKSDSTVHHH